MRMWSMVLFLIGLAGWAQADAVIKANNASPLNDPASWTNHVVPTTNDMAVWNAILADPTNATNVLSADANWLGIRVLDPAGVVILTTPASSTLTLGSSGIDMASASADLTVRCPVILSASQSWNVATGRVLSLNTGGGTTLVTSASGMTKDGAGTLTLLGGSLRYTAPAPTLINAGVVRCLTNNLLPDGGSQVSGPTGNVFIAAGATLEVMTETLSGLNGSGTVSIVGANQLTIGSTWVNSRFDGVITGASLKQNGVGESYLANPANTYTGSTFIAFGVLSVSKLANAGVPSSLGAPTTVANATLSLGSGLPGALKYLGTGDSTDRKIDLTSSGALGGSVLDASGSGPLIFTSDFAASVAGSKTLTLQGSNAGTNTIAGAIIDGNGTVSVIKGGSGRWVLGGTNTYSGATLITNGTLAVNGYLAGGGAVTVTNAGTLAGTGRLQGSLSVQKDGTLSPAGHAKIGTLTAGSAVWSGGGKYSFEIGDAVGTPGIGYDSLVISNTLAVQAVSTAPFIIMLVSLSNGVSGQTQHFNCASNSLWTIAVAGGGILPAADNTFIINTNLFLNPTDGGTFLITQTRNALQLAFVPTGGVTQITVETAPDGSGTVVPATGLVAGSNLTVYAVAHNAAGGIMTNAPPPTWSLENLTGEIAPGDLIPSGAQATFTAHRTGSTVIRAALPGVVTTSSGTLTVNANVASQIQVETSDDGNGMLVPAQNVEQGRTLTIYAISRDDYGNFVANAPADTWTLINLTGTVITNDLVPGGATATFTAHSNGTANIHASKAGLTSVDSGTLAVVTPSSSAEAYGLASMTAFNRLPYLRPDVMAGQQSSFDRAGGNNDGFGASNFLYTDESGDKVMLDLKGPGVVYRIWSTGFTAASANLKVYVDDDVSPRINMLLKNLFVGTNAPFLSPLVGNNVDSSGGYYCYLPIPFSKSIRITTNGKGANFFYHVGYHLFSPDRAVTSWTGNEDTSTVMTNWLSTGTDPKGTAGNTIVTGRVHLATGETKTLLDISGTNSICAIRLKIPQVPTPAATARDILTNVWLRIAWDNEAAPSVAAPLGSYFAMGQFGAYATHALPVGLDTQNVMYCFFPMPFSERARIELLSYRTITTSNIDFEIQYKPFTDSFSKVGYFKALFHGEEPTTDGSDVLMLDQEGMGQFVGIVQSVTGPTNRNYLEGDERVYVDDSRSPVFQGTGTEDFYNGGWYFNQGPFTLPVHGYTAHKTGATDSSAMYRFFLQDMIPFRKHIRVSIEHGWVNDIPADEWMLAFYYHRADPRAVLTDTLDIGNATSESAHLYVISNATGQGTQSYAYEGDFNNIVITDDGRATTNFSKFTVTVNPDNQGVILRRRFDQALPNPAADVYVDGNLVGRWYKAGSNEFLPWRDDDFMLPGFYTAGKSKLQIRLQSASSNTAWNEFAYWAYSIMPAPVSLTTHTLTVASPHGTPNPSAGPHSYGSGTLMTNFVSSPVILGGATQYVCTGWILSGHEPSSGWTNRFTMTLTNSATLTWLWTTNYVLAASAGAHGSVTPTNSWQALGFNGSVSATADPYYHFAGWSGSVASASNPLSIYMDASKTLVACFAENVAYHGTPEWWMAHYDLTNDASFDTTETNDPDSDKMLTWQEYVAGTIPTDSNSTFRILPSSFTDGNDTIRWLGGNTSLPPFLIYMSTNLMDIGTPWSWVTNVVRAGSGTNSCNLPFPPAGAARFYRIVATNSP